MDPSAYANTKKRIEEIKSEILRLESQKPFYETEGEQRERRRRIAILRGKLNEYRIQRRLTDEVA